MATLTLDSPAEDIVPLGGELKNSAGSGARVTATATSTSTHVDIHDEAPYDNQTEPNAEEHRPRRRLFRVVSRCLPFLLTAVVAYIYYVYTVRVCIQYLLHFKRNVVQASFYLAIFNVAILLFFVSYALSILRTPGSPSNPPVRVPPPTIPLTTTPYRQKITPPSSLHYDSSQGGVSSPGPSSSVAMAPTTDQSSHLPHTRTASSVTGTSSLHSYAHSLPTSIAQHSGPHLGSITTAPKYPTSAVAPVSLGSVGSEAHVEIPIPPETHVQASATSRGHSLGVGGGHYNNTGGGVGRVSPDNQGSGLRSRHTTDESGQQPPIATLSISKRDGRPRWCQFCKTVKPDRCHHCSECNRCVLRMDHHCPWVNGCIGFGNYKYFYLFIFYGSVAALWVAVTMVPLIMQAIQDCELEQEPPRSGNGSRIRGGSPTFAADLIPRMMLALRDKSSWAGVDVDRLAPRPLDVQWIVITVLAFLLALLIVSFTGAHTAYILNNRTTIESLQDTRNMFIRVQYRKMDFNGDDVSANVASLSSSLPATGPLPSFMTEIEFNVVMIEQGERLWDRGSWTTNWKSVMGPTWWLWFLPYRNTPGDGIHEVYNEKVYRRLVADALAQARMQVINFGGLGEELTVQGISSTDNESNSNAGPRDHLETIAVAPPSPRLERISTTEISALPGPSSAPLPSSKSLSSRLGSSGNNSPQDAIYGGSSSGSKRGHQNPALRRSSSASAAVMLPSIRFETAPEAPTLDAQSRAAIELQIRSSCSPEAALVRTSNDGSSSRGGRTSGYSTPKQASARSQSPRQRSPKSPSHSQPQSESSRRRQRTMSGGTSGSFGVAAREFGMGLGMDGIPVDSGTGLKLSSGLLGRTGQTYGKGHGRQQSYQ
ncbi:hypothetical protein BGZ75_009532 [Mortierella antarctica]|nr:hypothetical protein BGZ75_009532 [Mortierella antarctica]